MPQLPPTHWAYGLSPAECLSRYRARRAEFIEALRSDRSPSDRISQLRREAAIEAVFLRDLAGLT